LLISSQVRIEDIRKQPRIIAVDGPAASGKSSICAKVSQRIGWTYVNTGAIYRAIGFLADSMKVDVYNQKEMLDLVTDFSENFIWQANEQKLYYASQDLTGELQSEVAGRNASRIARIPELRENLLEVQRRLVFKAKTGALVDGRDIGSVVFPEADLKIYLTASLLERSKRRYKQLVGATCKDVVQPTLEDIKSEIAARDEQDLNREVAPLVRAADAILLDTSHLTLEDTIETMIGLIREHIPF